MGLWFVRTIASGIAGAALALPAQPTQDVAPAPLFNNQRIALAHATDQPIDSNSIAFVRFDRPLSDDLIRLIKQSGLELGPHVGGRVFLLRQAPGRSAPGLAAPFASALAPPQLRIEHTLFDRAQARPDAVLTLNLLAWDSDPGTIARLARHCATLGAEVENPHTTSRRLVVHAPASALTSLAESPDLLWIDAWSPPESDMDVVRAMSGVDAVETVAGFTGQGVVGEVMDAGLRVTHADLQARPPIMHTPGGPDPSHGTPVFGIIFGSGATDPASRGIIPDAQGLFASHQFVTDRAAHTRDLLSEPYRASFQSNSWGSGLSRTYTSVSAELDQIAFDNDLLIVQSQSNAGTQDSRPEAWAKNVLSVGGVVHQNTPTLADDRWAQQASVGPAIDGRIKPDLAHAFDSIFTIASSSDSAHADFWGTSAATPAVAGCAGLAIQMFAQGLFANPTSGGDVFDERPHAGTTRALLINAARQWEFACVADDLGRFRQGWGVPDLASLYESRDRVLIVDQTDLLVPFSSRAYVVDVTMAEPSLSATLVYPDPPGLPGSIVTTQNDLSLRLTSPDGTVYLGNVGLIDGTVSRPGGEFDRVNTVERVFLPKPLPGRWVVEVVAGEFTADGFTPTPELDATYALVVSGAVERPDAVRVSVPDGVPQLREPYRATPLSIRVEPASSPVDQVLVEWRSINGGGGTLTPTPAGDHTFEILLPLAPCGDTTELAVRVHTSDGQTTTWPEHWPAAGLSIPVGVERTLFAQTFATNGGWSGTATAGLTGGAWNFGAPLGGGLRGDPPTDADGSGKAWLTQRAAGDSDVDGATAILTSNRIDLLGVPSPLLRFAYWLSCDDSGSAAEDVMQVEISGDNGSTWLPAATLRSTFAWRDHTLDLGTLLGPTDSVRLRFSIADDPNDSVTEAGIDFVRVLSRSCDLACPADLNTDGVVDFFDLQAFLDAYASRNFLADVNADGVVDFFDLQAFLNLYTDACD